MWLRIQSMKSYLSQLGWCMCDATIGECSCNHFEAGAGEPVQCLPLAEVLSMAHNDGEGWLEWGEAPQCNGATILYLCGAKSGSSAGRSFWTEPSNILAETVVDSKLQILTSVFPLG